MLFVDTVGRSHAAEIIPIVAENIPEFLSSSSVKRALYAIDTYFVETFRLAAAVFGEELESQLSSLCSILLKPETMASRRADLVIENLKQKGFHMCACIPVELDRTIAREIWRYQINAYSEARLRFMDRWITTAPALYCVLRDGPPHCDNLRARSQNAADRLTRIKGNSNPGKVAPGSLRGLLGHSIDIINYVHTADDPADFLRDMGILFGPDRCHALLSSLNDDRSEADWRTEIQTCYQKIDRHDLNVQNAFERAKLALPGNKVLIELSDLAASMEYRQTGSFHPMATKLVLELESQMPSKSTWDWLLILAFFTAPLAAQKTSIIPALLDRPQPSP